MGHANIDTTMIYAHSVPKHDAADALSSLVTNAVRPHAIGSVVPLVPGHLG